MKSKAYLNEGRKKGGSALSIDHKKVIRSATVQWRLVEAIGLERFEISVAVGLRFGAAGWMGCLHDQIPLGRGDTRDFEIGSVEY